jgi:hypothetical protein
MCVSAHWSAHACPILYAHLDHHQQIKCLWNELWTNMLLHVYKERGKLMQAKTGRFLFEKPENSWHAFI